MCAGGPLLSQSHGRMSRSEYFETYREMAVHEMHRSGVPASITLAQGALESGDGNSTLARSANNHFGIVCTSEWVGQRVLANNRCYRSYESVWASFRDHSLFLKQTHFTHLNKLSKSDYKGWAMGLENAGYPEMNAADLIEIIEMYHLN